MRSFVTLLAALLLMLVPASGAAAQEQIPGTIERAVDGDTINVRIESGSLTVRLIGIDTPETMKPGTPVECGGREATEAMARWEGQPVTLTTDPSQDRTDRFGRLLAYAEVFGQDIGLAAIVSGLSDVYVYDNRPFTRQPNYEAARDRAQEEGEGSWATDACAGDFHSTVPTDGTEDETEEDVATPSRADTAKRFVRSHYFRLSGRRYDAAWSMFGASLRGRLGPYGAWRAGYRTTVSIRVNATRATLIGGGRAVVIARFRARDRDACSGGVRQQFFRARWVLLRVNGAWRATGITASKVGGQPVRLSKSACVKPKPTPQPARRPSDGGGGGGGNGGDGCHPSYSPCIPNQPGDYYNCGDLSNGPYRLTGPDQYGLDGDSNGVGCQ